MKGDIFKARPEAFRRSVLKLLKTRFFMPGDSLYVYGQPATEMYFIIDGSAVVRLCCASPLTVRCEPSVRYSTLRWHAMPCLERMTKLGSAAPSPFVLCQPLTLRSDYRNTRRVLLSPSVRPGIDGRHPDYA